MTVVTIPTVEELPVVRGLQELGAKAPKSRKRPLPRLEEEHLEEDQELGPWEAPVDRVQEELTEAEITKVQVLAKEWKDFVNPVKADQPRTSSMAFPGSMHGSTSTADTNPSSPHGSRKGFRVEGGHGMDGEEGFARIQLVMSPAGMPEQRERLECFEDGVEP